GSMGKPASATDVAAFVQKVVGDKLKRRTAKLRAIVAALDEAEALRSTQRPLAIDAAQQSAAASSNDELWIQDEDEITQEEVPLPTVPTSTPARSTPPPADASPKDAISLAAISDIPVLEDIGTETAMIAMMVRKGRNRKLAIAAVTAGLIGLLVGAIAFSTMG